MRLLRNFVVAAEHCAGRIPNTVADDFAPGEGLLVMDGLEIIAAVVYHGWRPTNAVIEMTIAASHPKWATRGTIRALLWYPFGQLGVTKAMALVDPDNKRSLKLVEGLGFEREAVLKRHAAGRDLVVCSMFRETWAERWTNGREIISQAA